MYKADRLTIESGTPGFTLMQAAGSGIAKIIQEEWLRQSVLVLAGPGNNGGDGLVAGRYLAQAGADVAFYLYRPRDAQTDENFAQIEELGLFQANVEDDQGYRQLRLRLQGAEILIDALLGTGVDRPIGGELAKLMQQVHAGLDERRESTSQAPSQRMTSIASLGGRKAPDHPLTVAVDCPSGLNTDTGDLDPLALEADLTVTFAGPKRGHFLFPGAGAVGELVVADIGVGAQLPEVQAVSTELATADLARRLLPPRPLAGHKGTFGKVLAAGGSARYWGAPLLCGRGAYRAGAGWVALAVPRSVRPVAAAQLPEATYPLVPDRDNFSAEGARFLLDVLPIYDAFLLGPGLGAADDFVAALLDGGENVPPLVVDADGLNVLSRMERWPERLPANTVLTPHPGEMARPMDVDLGLLKERDRIELARAQAQAWNHVVLLKGAYTVVAAPDGRATVLPFANPILGIAGSGDVLAGIIVALLGQGLAPYEGAVLGGYLHAAAGQLAGEEMGDAGLLSGELADWVPEVRRRLQEAA
jgi:NAD(P)H-hydrate epimerase